MKKLLSVTLATVMAVSLTACTGTVDSETANTGTTPAAGTTAGTETTAASGKNDATSGDTIKIGVLTDRSSAAAATVTGQRQVPFWR